MVELYSLLWVLASKAPRNRRISIMREIARADGPVNPVGDCNAKTALPSTYRPVGKTCPQDCRFLQPPPFNPKHPRRKGSPMCLALFGKTGKHQAKASPDAGPSLRAAAIAMISAAQEGNPARLHVGGDLGRTWAEASVYVDGLREMSRFIRDRAGDPARVTAFGYTHLPMNSALYGLWSDGLMFRRSDYGGYMGAMTGAHSKRPSGAFKCLEQVSPWGPENPNGYTCSTCRMCWTHPHNPVLFKPARGHFVDELETPVSIEPSCSDLG